MNEQLQEAINEQPNLLIQNFLDDCGFFERDNNNFFETISNKNNHEDISGFKVNHSINEKQHSQSLKSSIKSKRKKLFAKKKCSESKQKFRLKLKNNSKCESTFQNIPNINQCNMKSPVNDKINSMFSFHTNFFQTQNFYENSLFSFLSQLFTTQIKENFSKNSANNTLEKIILETNFAITVLNKFCDFLFQNGYSIIKKSEKENHIHHYSSVIFEENNASKYDSKRSKEIRNCPHIHRKHYAKNMCNNCYHKEGRAKRAWLCPHKNKPHYAKGRCQLCYLNYYHEKKVLNNIVGLSKGTLK